MTPDPSNIPRRDGVVLTDVPKSLFPHLYNKVSLSRGESGGSETPNPVPGP